MQIDKFNEVLEELQRERGIHKEALLDAIRVALLTAAKKNFKEEQEDALDVRISDTGDFRIIHKTPEGEVDVTPKDFGRTAAQTAKQVIIQKIREAEKEESYGEFAKKQGEIVTGVIQRREYSGYLVNLGRIETLLVPAEQIPGEMLREQERVRLYVVEVNKTGKGPQIVVSRSHPNLVRKLFEMEIPEINDGILEIKAIAREAGKRTKIAILSKDEKIGAIGTCVGHNGVRIQNIVRELGAERIDIIEWSEDPVKFIINALSPAKVSKVIIDREKFESKVYVSDNDLSLAIGKEGQNVRLAVKLTGWKIDILSETAPAQTLDGSKDTKIKVHELAKKMDVKSSDLIEKLQALGFDVKAATSVVPAEAIEKLNSNAKIPDPAPQQAEGA